MNVPQEMAQGARVSITENTDDRFVWENVAVIRWTDFGLFFRTKTAMFFLPYHMIEAVVTYTEAD